MDNSWSTKEKDMKMAQSVMEEYALKQNTEYLGLFELVVNQTEKQMNFRLSDWVLTLAKRFHAMYGVHQGDYIIRQVVTQCMTRGETMH